VQDLVIKQTASYRPKVLMEVFNKCFRKDVFPIAWKRSKLDLLRKEDKPLDQPQYALSTYSTRPGNCSSVSSKAGWKPMYDSLLQVDLQGNYPGSSSSSLIVFANDVSVITTKRNTNIIEKTINNALAEVTE